MSSPVAADGLSWADRVDLWDRGLAALRTYFRGSGLREVSTPVRVAGVAVEPFIEPIAAPPGYLATSPELVMKRLLCRGSGSIFQISHVFRSAERGARHSEEFHLIEWYRVNAPLALLRRDVEALIDAVFGATGRDPVDGWSSVGIMDVIEATLGLALRGDEDSSELVELAAKCGLNIVASGLDDPAPEVRRLAAWTAFLSEWSDQHLDPWLATRQGTHLCDFPPALAALSEIREVDGVVRAARFESFVGGLELANGYQELRDPVAQEARFAAVLGLRAAHGLPPLACDGGFLEDLRGYGLPACAGVA
ncbi:MAG TPA: hypothetical protein ENJ18_02160, partial [Nannocystis exedens]|nr:hypothetical protein [Nannocystis exedens]